MANLNDALNFSLKNLKGIGQKRALLYSKIGLNTFFDLLCHFPKKYDDCSKLFLISEVLDGEKCCIKTKIVKKMKVVKTKKVLILKAMAVDEQLNEFNVVFFNSLFMFNKLHEGKTYFLFGKIEKNGFNTQLMSPKIVLEKNLGYVAKYVLVNGLKSEIVSNNVKQILQQIKIEEILPEFLLKKFKLISRHEAFFKIHFPKNELDLKIAKRRLIFEELFLWQLGLQDFKKTKLKPNKFKLHETNLTDFLKVLPFKLTDGQLNVLHECLNDCCGNFVMNRLIQGDVGCGKTVIAQALSFLFVKSGWQVAIMAPTEILARQHFENFVKLFSKFNVKVELLIGALKEKEHVKVLEYIKTGQAKIIIGTHSLFSKNVEFFNLALAITDEQHRFGVAQRLNLTKKSNFVHVLVMSATPVPRTLALTVFADVDVSVIKTLPKNRAKTKTVHIASNKRARALFYILSELKKGHQAYIVCPLINTNEKTQISVENYYKNLTKIEQFKKFKIAMLHGKLSADEKSRLMTSFAKKEIDVLISTTIVEVGINNVNATVILIENAHQFGLATLHQLRGRVGRGCLESICILVSDATAIESKKRLKTMCLTNDGFEIAKFDLILRGPGDFFGTNQHGVLNFKIANLIKNLNIVQISKKEAEQFLNSNKLSNNEILLNEIKKFFKIDLLVL